MTVPPALITLASYLAGEFDNRDQALADPAWYVHLRLWQRPIPLFREDSLTLFVEQANAINSEQPYRQRLLRLMVGQTAPTSLQVQYYKLNEPTAFRGAGQNRELLRRLRVEEIECLESCKLAVLCHQVDSSSYKFSTQPMGNTPCRFSYQGKTSQVSLGFEATEQEFCSYDKGIDPETGKATWGALMGPFRFRKRRDFADELSM